MKRWPLVVVTLWLILLVAAARADTRLLKRVTFIPQWIPQAQFAGYYVAYKLGYYQKRGLNVEILQGGANSPSSDLLANGTADIGTMFLSTALIRRSQNIPLVNIAQIVQRSSIMLVAKKKSGIYKPEEIAGRKVGLWGPEFQVAPKLFFKKLKLRVQIVRQSETVNLFLFDAVDVTAAMWYNEYHTIINSGLDPDQLTTFFLHDYGINFPEDGIYCLAEFYQRNPGLCCAFTEASLEGWQYAFEHPRQALDIVMEYVNKAHIATNRIHQKWMLARMKDIIVPGGGTRPDPTLKPDDYYLEANEMKNQGLLKTYPDYQDFFKGCGNHAAKAAK